MEALGISRAHPLSLTGQDEVTTPPGSIRDVSASHPQALEIKALLQNHYDPHYESRPCLQPNPSQEELDAAQDARVRNQELNDIVNARTQRLAAMQQTPADVIAVEKTADKVDLLFQAIKAGIGGAPFAAATLGTNLHPSSLAVFSPENAIATRNALESALACIYASATDASGNNLLRGWKPESYQHPADEQLHSSMQRSLADKRLLQDKGTFGNAIHDGFKWLTGFLARNGVLFPVALTLAHYEQAKLATKIENIFRPVSAVGVGILIEMYNASQDRKHHLAGPALLYGRRDAPLPNGERKPIAEETEWVHHYQALQALDASGLLKMIPERAGKGITATLTSAGSFEFLQSIFTPSNLYGALALAAGFAAMSGLTTLTRQLAESHHLTPTQAAAAAELVKNVLGAFAFGLWAMGASLGESLSKKAVNAANAHVGKGVENGLNAVGRASARGVAATKESTVKLTKVTGRELHKLGEATSTAVSSSWQATKENGAALYGRGRGLSNRAMSLMHPNSAAPAPTQELALASVAPQAAGPTVAGAASTEAAALQAMPSSRDPGDIV